MRLYHALQPGVRQLLRQRQSRRAPPVAEIKLIDHGVKHPFTRDDLELRLRKFRVQGGIGRLVLENAHRRHVRLHLDGRKRPVLLGGDKADDACRQYHQQEDQDHQPEPDADDPPII
jgi:hypothetical protein